MIRMNKYLKEAQEALHEAIESKPKYYIWSNDELRKKINNIVELPHFKLKSNQQLGYLIRTDLKYRSFKNQSDGSVFKIFILSKK